MPFVWDVENNQQLCLPYLLSFFRRRSNFPTQRQRHPAAQPPFYFLFMRDFQTKAVLVLLFFKCNDAKTKTSSSSTSFALSLSSHIWLFQYNAIPTSFPLSSPRWFCILHQDKRIYCLVFSSPLAPFLLSPILHFSHPPTCWQCLASCMACFADLQKSRPFWESQCQTSG